MGLDNGTHTGDDGIGSSKPQSAWRRKRRRRTTNKQEFGSNKASIATAIALSQAAARLDPQHVDARRLLKRRSAGIPRTNHSSAIAAVPSCDAASQPRACWCCGV